MKSSDLQPGAPSAVGRKSSAGKARGGPLVHRWVRLALYIVLLVVALLTYWQTRQQQRSEEVRQADAEIIRIAGAQSAQIQRMNMP